MSLQKCTRKLSLSRFLFSFQFSKQETERQKFWFSYRCTRLSGRTSHSHLDGWKIFISIILRIISNVTLECVGCVTVNVNIGHSFLSCQKIEAVTISAFVTLIFPGKSIHPKSESPGSPDFANYFEFPREKKLAENTKLWSLHCLQHWHFPIMMFSHCLILR